MTKRSKIALRVVRICHAALIALVASLLLTVRPANSQVSSSGAADLLVRFEPQADTPGVVGSIAGLVGQVTRSVPGLHVYRVRLAGGISIEEAMVQLQARSEVVYAEPNYVRRAVAEPNDPYYSLQWGPQRIQADLAWPLWSPQAPAVIAILDSGIDSTRMDLFEKMDRTPLGLINGFDAITRLPGPALDDHGHGTHVAGIAGARVNNLTGIAGVAGWNGQPTSSDTAGTKLMPVKVLSALGLGFDDDIAAGIVWAADHGAKVLNLSLGGPEYSATLAAAVQYAWENGCVIAAAAGNEGTSLRIYPAALANVISVAATDSSDRLTAFSSYGTWVKTAAPGDAILSTMPGYPVTLNGLGYALNYEWLSGTSMASPHVAGGAALIMAHDPALSNSQVSSLIVDNTDPYAPNYVGGGIGSGAGRINLYKALRAAEAGTVAPGLPPAPTALTATVATKTRISLAWQDNAADEEGYAVERASDSSAFKQVATLGANATTYASNGMKAGVTYSFRVRAFNNTGVSAYSNTATAAVPPK